MAFEICSAFCNVNLIERLVPHDISGVWKIDPFMFYAGFCMMFAAFSIFNFNLPFAWRRSILVNRGSNAKPSFIKRLIYILVFTLTHDAGKPRNIKMKAPQLCSSRVSLFRCSVYGVLVSLVILVAFVVLIFPFVFAPLVCLRCWCCSSCSIVAAALVSKQNDKEATKKTAKANTAIRKKKRNKKQKQKNREAKKQISESKKEAQKQQKHKKRTQRINKHIEAKKAEKQKQPEKCRIKSKKAEN